jgi:hypothetical protein
VATVPNTTLAISGQYISGIFNTVPGSLLAPEAVMHLIPILPGRNITINQLAINVTVAGGVGSLVRMGIYNDANDQPSTLLVDAGVMATDTVGLKTIPVSVSLVGGIRYWLCSTQQGLASPTATYTSFTQATGTVTTTDPTGGFNGALKLGISGALPNPVTGLGVLGSQVMLRTLARVL